MSNFMRKQITRKMNWIQVETKHGTEWIPGDIGLFVRNSDSPSQPLTDEEFARYKKQIWQYTEGEPESWENVQGYGARLSAPGYLDCTEWAVFDTEAEAQRYLDEMYSDDEDEEEEDSL